MMMVEPTELQSATEQQLLKLWLLNVFTVGGRQIVRSERVRGRVNRKQNAMPFVQHDQ